MFSYDSFLDLVIQKPDIIIEILQNQFECSKFET